MLRRTAVSSSCGTYHPTSEQRSRQQVARIYLLCLVVVLAIITGSCRFHVSAVDERMPERTRELDGETGTTAAVVPARSLVGRCGRRPRSTAVNTYPVPGISTSIYSYVCGMPRIQRKHLDRVHLVKCTRYQIPVRIVIYKQECAFLRAP